MKKIFLAAAALMFTVGAFAGEYSGSGNTSVSTSGSVAGATNDGNTQQITFTSPADTKSHVEYSGTQTLKNTPSVNGPPLVSSNDTCMGSVSGSVNVAGFGVGGGSTTVDKSCVRLKNARELWNMGMRAAALALMCNDDENRTALEQTGFKCPERKTDQPEVTDPIVRRRLGLKN